MLFRYILIALCALGSAETRAETESLSLNQAVALAAPNAPQVAAQSAAAASLKETAVQSRQLPDPKLKLGIINVPTDTFSLTEDFMTMRTIGIEQMVPGGNKRALRGARAEQQAGEAAAQMLNTRLEAQRDTALAWLDAYNAIETRTLLQEQEREANAEVEALRINYRAGKIQAPEILATQIELSRLKDRELELRSDEDKARAELARWIGTPAFQPIDRRLESPSPPSFEVAASRLEQHPQIVALDRRIAAAEADTDLAREGKHPDWSVEVGYAKRGPAYADMVSAQVAVDLPIFPADRQHRDVAAKTAVADQLRAEREARLRQLTAELKSRYTEWRSVNGRQRLFESSILPDAAQRSAASRTRFAVGQMPLSTVLAAHHLEIEMRMQLLALKIAQARAAIQIAYLVGGTDA